MLLFMISVQNCLGLIIKPIFYVDQAIILNKKKYQNKNSIICFYPQLFVFILTVSRYISLVIV